MDYKFKDTKFMSAEEKEKVLKNWERFIRSVSENVYEAV